MAASISNRKLYAMKRMSLALQRAAAARPLGPTTDRSLRWATAWGLVAGIRTPRTRIRLRRTTLRCGRQIRPPNPA
jgi:hypothetical protein